ncbi:hypothetical protein BY457_102233 [Marinilabilia salmonicolor]|jgi:hypothetical protein|nr:hypothetical protein BY457_102233 [Marinilabilia salmonicolor]
MKRAWQGMSQKTMYKFLTCEFHQTNNLDKLYTDEKTGKEIRKKCGQSR